MPAVTVSRVKFRTINGGEIVAPRRNADANGFKIDSRTLAPFSSTSVNIEYTSGVVRYITFLPPIYTENAHF